MNISAIRARLFRGHREKENALPLKDMGLIDHIEKIAEISAEHGIDRCLAKGKAHLGYVCGKLEISPEQAVLFSHFLEKGMDSRIEIGEIAEAIKCRKIRVIKYTGDCEELEKKRLIRCRRGDDSVTYRVPREVTESLRKHEKFLPEKMEGLSIEEFFEVLERLFDERENKDLTWESMCLELRELIDMNMHLLFCKKFMGLNFDRYDATLLLCFCHLFVNNNDDFIREGDLDFLYEDRRIFRRTKTDLADGSHELMEAKLVDYANSDGFVDTEHWKLSDIAKKELLSELNLEKSSYKNRLILHGSIKAKTMFYNTEETAQVQKLTTLLQEENFVKIQDRLDGRGLRKGFACLFSGGPGTGKTETAYQIARMTGRNIMLVDIAQTKSMWFGESEKKIKEIFDSYRNAVEKSEVAPILLLNEADAVIGKRKDIAPGNGAVAQTENTIQNIILQEMENLSGIMLATTNLARNMDTAFERRFLYKIVFDKPVAESRMGIWRSLLPDLPEDDARRLSGAFALSGGQIENIVRKTEVDSIINSGDISMEVLEKYCMDEMRGGFDTSKPLGFCNK